MSEIVEIIDERKTQKQQQQKNKDGEQQEGTKALMKGWELNDFVAHLS